MKYTLTLPTSINLPRKTTKDKKYLLNLNHFRNAHYRLNNEAKQYYKKVVAGVIETLPKFTTPISITYKVMLSRRVGDVANVASIVDKFFCDALVGAKKLNDDSYKHLPKVIYQFECINKDNPCCLVVITTL
jgi:hypothetical protein